MKEGGGNKIPAVGVGVQHIPPPSAEKCPLGKKMVRGGIFFWTKLVTRPFAETVSWHDCGIA